MQTLKQDLPRKVKPFDDLHKFVVDRNEVHMPTLSTFEQSQNFPALTPVSLSPDTGIQAQCLRMHEYQSGNDGGFNPSV